MTNDQVDRMIQDHNQKISEVWALFKETREQMKETDKKIEALTKNVDRVTSETESVKEKWGRFAESIVAPGVKRVFQERGIELRQIFQNAEAFKDGNMMEIDILAVNTIYVVLVEVKSTLSQDDVKEHLEHMARFKDFFPQYANHKVLGAVAGIIMPKEVTRFAYQKGLFVIGQSGETIEILNDTKFKPKEW